MSRIQVLLLALLFVSLPNWASGKPVSVEIMPPHLETDSIFLNTAMEWHTAGFNVIGSSVTFLSKFEPQVDITVSSPAPDEMVPMVLTGDVHGTDLGVLTAGTYYYTVNEIHLQRNTDSIFPAGSLSGSFTVAPEPSSLGFALLGLAGLTIRRRRRN